MEGGAKEVFQDPIQPHYRYLKMPSRCCVPQCNGNYPHGPKVAIFSFPKDEKLAAEWVKAIKRDHFEPTHSSRVCELHFAPEDIEREMSCTDEQTGFVITVTLKVPRLRKGAVPSRIPQCPTHLSRTLATTESTGRKEPRKEHDGTQAAVEESDGGGGGDSDRGDGGGDNDDIAFVDIDDFKEEVKMQFETLSDLYGNIDFSDKYWKVIEVDDDSLMICNITCEPNPKIRASVIIDNSLSVRVFVDEAEMQTLGTYTVPSHVKDVETLEELLKNLKKYNTSDRNFTPGKVLFLLQHVLSILTILRQESSKYKNVLKGMCEQIQLMTMKKVEYSSEFLVFSSLLYSCSPHGYRLLRTMGHLILPCYSTVRSLSLSQNLTPVTEHHHERNYFLSYIKNKLKFLKTDDLTVTLSIDEIQIEPFFDCKGGSNGVVGSPFSSNEAATSAYVFMVKSLQSKFKDLVHILPTRIMIPEILFAFTRKIIIGLEKVGFKVVCVVTDSNLITKKAISNFAQPPTLSIVYPHPSLASRPLFFLFDAADVLKSVRSSWLDQKDPDRTMKYPQFFFDETKPKQTKVCNAPFAALRSINDLEEQSHSSHGSNNNDNNKLTKNSVCPSNLEKQNVNLVHSIFNEHVIEAVLSYGKKFCVPHHRDVAQYVKIMYVWWTVMHVESLFTGCRLKHNYAFPLTDDIYNEGYIFLHKFCDWLDNWGTMHISGKLRKEAMTAIRHTTLGMIELTNYCIHELKIPHVLTAKFQMDRLEARFNKYRQFTGGNYNVSMRQVFEAEKKLRQKKELKMCIQLPLQNQSIDLTDLMEMKWDEMHTDDASTFNNHGVEITRDDIEESMKYLTSLTYLAGYCCYVVTKRNKCSSCKDLLTCNENVEDVPDGNTFLRGMNSDSLLYPDERVVSIVMYNYITLNKLTASFDSARLLNQRNAITDITMNLLADNDVFLPISKCSNEHSINRVQKMIVWASTNALLKNYCNKQNGIILLSMIPGTKRKVEELT